ncbi:cysteine peptidase family C39 domain-containing protein [Prevotella sp.]
MKKFPLRLQKDSMKCGPSCLQMVFKYYGVTVSNDTIDLLCHATKEGVSLLSLQEVAFKFGFKCFCIKLSCEKLMEIMKPCILHWNQNHFVVLYKVAHFQIRCKTFCGNVKLFNYLFL